MTIFNHKILLAIVVGLFLYGCATPMAPTGGEPDRTGPQLVETSPVSGTVNFQGNEISFTFDKFIERNSFRQNISLEPDLGIELDVSFRRKTATVSFQSPLPENTTVALRVGGDVTDTNRNKMGNPVTVAISTGPELDDGIITATIIDALTGERTSGRRVFLYRDTADLSTRAIYTAETDTSGRVSFGFIGEGRYRAFWVNDVNRSRTWDREREPAQPFYVNYFEVGKKDSVHIGPLYVSAPDTIAPRLEGVGLLSERRLRLRFSEPVQTTNDSYFILADTLDNEITTAYPLYSSEEDPAILFAQSSDPLRESETYTLQVVGLQDEAGNNVRSDLSPFAGSSEPDTTRLITISHNTGSGLFPTDPVEVTYSKFIDDSAVLDSLRIIEGDRVMDDWEYAEIDRNILRIRPETTWSGGVQYQFRVWNPWEEERELIEPEIWQSNQLGSIELRIANADSTKLSYVTVRSNDESIRVDTTFTGSIEIDNLPPLTYSLTVFEDSNENGRWNIGTVDPYSAPEPYAVRRNIPVREGFTSEVDLEYPSESVSRQEQQAIEPDAVTIPESEEIEDQQNR